MKLVEEELDQWKKLAQPWKKFITLRASPAQNAVSNCFD